jgi:hypothetical protein
MCASWQNFDFELARGVMTVDQVVRNSRESYLMENLQERGGRLYLQIWESPMQQYSWYSQSAFY